MTDFDLAIVGSSFAGSLLALVARRLGRKVLLVERSRHPRFAIGESSTPLAALLLEELALRHDLPQLLPFTKWGAWQAAHPEIAAGLKRGFSFYRQRPGAGGGPRPGRVDELLVAASPRDEIADTHWYRPDFDHFLVREAVAAGVEYVDETTLTAAEPGPDSMTVRGSRAGRPFVARAAWLADATGPRGFLHGALGLPEAVFPGYPRTEALYTHLSGVRRWDELHPADGPLPYPPDDAALHHVFPDGWMWVLRFNNGLTSAGVSLGGAAAGRVGLAEGGAAWQRLLGQYPAVGRQFEGARPVSPFIHHALLAFRSGQAAGPRWIQVATAAGFLDPLLSTGFPLALLGIQRLVSALEATPGVPDLAPLGAAALADLDAAGCLVGALYRVLGDFDTFRELTLLYFAAASFAETARRLGRPELAPGFLLRGHPVFGPGLREVASDAGTADPRGLRDRIRRLVEPFDVAGLTEETRGHHHPCLAADLFRSAHKLGVDAPAIEAMLRRTGFAGAP